VELNFVRQNGILLILLQDLEHLKKFLEEHKLLFLILIKEGLVMKISIREVKIGRVDLILEVILIELILILVIILQEIKEENYLHG